MKLARLVSKEHFDDLAGMTLMQAYYGAGVMLENVENVEEQAKGKQGKRRKAKAATPQWVSDKSDEKRTQMGGIEEPTSERKAEAIPFHLTNLCEDVEILMGLPKKVRQRILAPLKEQIAKAKEALEALAKIA